MKILWTLHTDLVPDNLQYQLGIQWKCEVTLAATSKRFSDLIKVTFKLILSKCKWLWERPERGKKKEKRNIVIKPAKRLHPHQRRCVTPSKGHPVTQEIWFSWLTIFWRSCREKQLQLAALQKSVVSGDFWDFSISVFLGCYGFSGNIGPLSLKSSSEMLKEESQNSVRQLHPLHLLQLPVFTMSFAVLIQGTIRKSRIRIGKGRLALLARGIKTCKLPSSQQKIVSLTGWFFVSNFDFFFFLVLTCICPCLWIVSSYFTHFHFCHCSLPT